MSARFDELCTLSKKGYTVNYNCEWKEKSILLTVMGKGQSTLFVTFRERYSPILVPIVLASVGAWMVARMQISAGTSPDVINYHYMLLDAWNLLFVGALATILIAHAARGISIAASLASVSIYGIVALIIVFAPSQFPDNGFWGDQKFRIAMIEHFMVHGTLTDYYYRDLPIFYPPTYYYTLAVLGKFFGITAYKVAQVGLGLLYVVMPASLYFLWRKLLSVRAALVVTVAVMLVDIGGSFMLVAVPHAFVANSFLVPWCLYYVFGIHRSATLKWQSWLAGSVIGALILSTYFYPFILLGFFLAASLILTLIFRKRRLGIIDSWPGALIVLCGVGLFSLWYWLPNVLAITRLGMDRSRGDWYYAMSGGLNFPFVDWNWTGALGLVAIVIALTRWKRRVISALLLLTLSCLFLFMIGSILGALDISINLTKDREFVWALIAPLIGLGFYTMSGKIQRHRSAKVFQLGGAVLLLLLCVQGMTRLAHDSYIEKARVTVAPNYQLTDDETTALTDKVLLASNEECFAFLPAKAFININEHYAHPASQFALRYDFLTHLCKICDRRLFHYALRHNRFDAIDYVFPERRGDSIWLYVALSAYPDGLVLKQLAFPAAFLEDTSLYQRVGKSSLYRVLNLNDDQLMRDTSSDGPSNAKAIAHSQATLSRLQQSRSRLPENFIIPHVNSLVDPAKPVWLDKSLLLTDCVVVNASDSMTVVATLRKNRPVHLPTRLYLHVYAPPNNDTLQNYDFPSSINIADWSVGDVVTVERRLPRVDTDFSFVLGIFGESGPWGRPFVGHVPVDSLNGYRVPPRNQEPIPSSDLSRR